MKAYAGLHPYAFMSYSHRDEEKIRPLIEKLQAIGCNIWYDQGIIPADEWAETVAKKLADADLFFLIVSDNSIASQNVKREIYYAVSNNIPILTFYLEKVELSPGLAMQLGVSQAVYSKDNTDLDFETISKVFPREVTSSKEPEVIYSASNYVYAFATSNTKNEYEIIRISRETGERRVLFRHLDSSAFVGFYTCSSIHFSPSDEFNPNAQNTLYFSVYSDLDHDFGVDAPDLYIEADFAIVRPNHADARLEILSCRKKRKNDPFEETEVYTDLSDVYWLRNTAEN